MGTCSSPPDLLEQVLHTGELRVATRTGPGTFYVAGEKARGVEFDLARGYARWLGVELGIHAHEQTQSILGDVATGKAHVGAAALSTFDSRNDTISYGPPYQHVRSVVIYRRGAPRPQHPADLVGGRLSVFDGSSHLDLVKDVRRIDPFLSWKEVAHGSASNLMARVADDRIDFAIIQSNDYDLLKYSVPGVNVAFALEEKIPVAWALRQGSDTSLRDSVAAYFTEIQASGELDRILERYYHHLEAEFDYVSSRAFVKHFHSRLPNLRAFFVRAAAEYDLDWRLLAAMAYQESHWNPGAVSPTGVRGMMMLTRDTAKMVDVQNRTDALESILGGARYLGHVMAMIPERIAYPDRTWLALAAYNVGFGHLEDARIITEIQGGNPDSWDDVRDRLPLLSDPDWHRRVPRGYARGSEPVRYVERVRRYYEVLQWMTATETAEVRTPMP